MVGAEPARQPPYVDRSRRPADREDVIQRRVRAERTAPGRLVDRRRRIGIRAIEKLNRRLRPNSDQQPKGFENRRTGTLSVRRFASAGPPGHSDSMTFETISFQG